MARDAPGMADIDSSFLLFCKEIKRNQNIKITGAKLENNADTETKNTKETQVKTVVNTTPKVRKK